MEDISHFFLLNRQRTETALLSAINEAYINGVSTRKMEHLAKELGVESISAGQVSNIAKDLDSLVKQLKDRPLKKTYSIIWVDALYERIRVDSKVQKRAVMVAMGITEDGKRELLDVAPMVNESEQTWTIFFDRLKARGVQNVQLLVSDGQLGIQAGLRNVFPMCEWQRCKVHFVRNILVRAPHKHKKDLASRLEIIWKQTTRDAAQRVAQQIVSDYAAPCPDAMDILENGLEDSLKFYDYPELPASRISSTNHLERLNQEIRRRTKVVSVFPSEDSYLRLVCAYLIEYEEETFNDRAYISPEKLTLAFPSKEVMLKAA